MRPALALARLEALRLEFGPAAARERERLLARLARSPLPAAAQVRRLHDLLCFACAFPDSPAVRRGARALLAGFARRPDLQRHRRALAGSGIAGTDTPFRFFAPTALRLARRHPEALWYDWREWPDPQRLVELLPLIAAWGETPGLDEWDLGLRGWLRRMTPRGLGDAAFVTQRLSARLPDPFVFERVIDGIDAPMILRATATTPAAGRERWPTGRTAWQRTPLRRARPDLHAALRTAGALGVTALPARSAARLIELAQDAMVSHGRDLDVFSYGDPRDVRCVDCGDGLQFAAIGARPERRLLLEAFYGFLMLKNGVPIGYLGASALYGSAEIAYNVFEPFRGAETAVNFVAVLAMVHRLFGVDAFTLYPYQLGGAGNDEGLDSGAWWFYRKLGFEPRARAARQLMRREEARIARNPAQRTTRATLARLAAHNLYWCSGRRRDDVMGLLPLANVGLAVTDHLARQWAADRGAAACRETAERLLGAGPGRGWSAGERLAFVRWAPLVALLPGVGRWPVAHKRALLAVIRAKGGRRESDYVTAFDAHGPLRAAIAALARATRP